MAVALALALGLQYVNRPRLASEVIAIGFDRPTALAALDGELVVAEQAGLVRTVADHEPVMDLRELVNDQDWEQGLFDLALHPNYPADDRLFISYSQPNNDVVVASVELGGEGTTPLVILSVPQPSPVHNGGRLAFGPDGYLYVGLGEGGPAEVPDPHDQGQDPDTLLATILRLDVDTREDGLMYAIPQDNPFVAGGGAPEVWAYGVRNPWGLSFDPGSGDLWIADVGHGAFEEVNRVAAGDAGGRNFGWSRYEGRSCLRPELGCGMDGLTMPVVVMPHAEGSCSVVGGQVYRGAAIPWLVGRYVFSDYCSGKVYSVGHAGESIDVRMEVDLAVQPTAVEVGADGELYVVTYGGEVLRLIDAD